MFAGDLAKRRRAKFVPGEAAAKVVQTKEPSHKDDFDEWLARIICYAFSVPPQWAVKLMNRATADNQSAQAQDEGLKPTKEWVKDLIDEIIADEFASPDLELAWLDEDEADPKGMEAVLEGRVKLGAVTLNEMRDALGLDPYANAAADRPMVLTATGYVPIEANAGPNGNSSATGTKACIGPQTAPITKNYDPDQPRVPAGNSEGGQWTSADDGSSPAVRYAATQVIVDPSAVKANPLIDGATAKLSAILVGIMNGLERAPGMTPQTYGRMVHEEFADAVIAAVLPGIAAEDVETTFPAGLPYGATNSIRTDVILRRNGP